MTSRSLKDPDAFYDTHRVFLWAASLQWLLVVILSGVMLQAWQREKRELVVSEMRPVTDSAGQP